MDGLKGWTVLLAGPLAALAVAIPWLVRPCGSGFDNSIHRKVVLGWLDAWAHGVVWPGYADVVNAGIGSYWPMYYPPLFHAAAAAGMSAGLDYWRAAMAALLLAQVGGSLLCHAWLRGQVGRGPALAGTLAFALAPYTMFNQYTRGAFPEGFAVAWLPGVFWGVDRVRERWGWRAAALGVVCFGLIGLGNLPALLVAGVTVGGYAAASGVVARDLGAFARGLAVPALGLGLTAFSWMAAWLDSGSVAVVATDLGQDPRSRHYIAFGRFDAPDFLYMTLYALAYFLLATGLVLALAARRRGGAGSRGAWELGVAILVIALGFSGTQASPFYLHLPVLHHVQYAWRFLGASSTGLSLLVAHAAASRARASRFAAAAALAAIAGFDVFAYGNTYPIDLARETSDRALVLAEFMPEGCKPPPAGHAPFPRVEVMRGRGSAEVVGWWPGGRVVAVRSEGPVTIALATYAHPRWSAVDRDGRPLRVARWDGDGLGRLAVLVPGGATDVSVTLGGTDDTAFAGAVSLIVLANVAALALIDAALARRGRGRIGGVAPRRRWGRLK